MRCLVLFSGSLESMLAARLMQQQGIEPVGLFFAAPCARSQPPSLQARQLGMRLIELATDASYYEALRHPTLGRTKNAAACLDCRVQLLRRARQQAEANASSPDFDTAFFVSGEVLGQRPRSQNRNDLEAVAYHAAVEDRLVRPLSAKLLPETLPERQGWIDRQQLQSLHGNAHKGLIDLAQQLGLYDLPASRPACGLADPALSARFFDHLQHSTSNEPDEFALLKIGRHFRFDASTKVVVGRNRDENELLGCVFNRGENRMVVRPIDFVGPTALLVGQITDETSMFAAALVKRFGKAEDGRTVELINNGCSRTVQLDAHPHAATAAPIGST